MSARLAPMSTHLTPMPTLLESSPTKLALSPMAPVIVSPKALSTSLIEKKPKVAVAVTEVVSDTDDSLTPTAELPLSLASLDANNDTATGFASRQEGQEARRPRRPELRSAMTVRSPLSSQDL